ncbi:MAG TPA: hypothetical protein DEP20_02885 [Fusobacteria bacterium]|nr:hypothetical protein [Fusobacteriota bacterium]|tara:strand:+ start:2340 stop:2489 length:150 start_codon:yes stop_codon:yes gene_type:complete
MEKKEKKRMLIRLEPTLSENLKKRAKLETRSMNSLVQHALKKYIEWSEQ